MVGISIDGAAQQRVDTSQPSGSTRLARQVIFAAHGLTPGRHTITMTKLSGRPVDPRWT
jgi:hypothetical protein